VPVEESSTWGLAGVAVDGQHADGGGIELVGVLLAGGDGDALGGGQALHAQVRAIGGELAAAKARGIPAVVIEPDVHVAFFGLSTTIFTAAKYPARGRGRCRPWARRTHT